MATSVEIIDKYIQGTKKSLDHYKELSLAVYRKRNQSYLENILAEQFIMSMGITWEAFIDDIMIVYFLKSPKKFLSNLDSSISQSITERYGPVIARSLKFSEPKNLTSEKARKILDPKGWNIGAGTSDKMFKEAQKILSARYARVFSFTDNDNALIDFVRSIRNYIGHRSGKSLQILKEAHSKLDFSGVDSCLNGRLCPIGFYLKCNSQPGRSRAEFIVNRLIQIAQSLK